VRDVAVPALALGVWSGRDRNVDGDLPSSSVGGASSTPAQALARAKRRRAASLPASCSSWNSTSALSSPTASAWRPSPRSASMRSSGTASRSSIEPGDLRPRERLTCGIRPEALPAMASAARGAAAAGSDDTLWNEANPCSQPTCEHPRMVGALVHLDVGAVLALHDRRHRRPGHAATARTARWPVAASSAIRARCDPRSAE
jgi:hypothetical protein